MTTTLKFNSRRTLRRCMGFLLIGIVFAVSAQAAVVRGQLQKVDENGETIPLIGITVTVSNEEAGRSPAVQTDSEGMYYINVPPGDYRLEIWTSKKPRAFKITVNDDAVTDIPAITL